MPSACTTRSSSHITAPWASFAETFPFDISGAIAAEIPAVDKLDQDPITTIKNGDMVEIDAPAVGEGHGHHYPQGVVL